MPGDDCPGWSLRLDPPGLLEVDVSDQDASSLAGETKTDRPPKVGRTAGDDDNAVLQRELHKGSDYGAAPLRSRSLGRAERLGEGTLGFGSGLRADPGQPKSRNHADLGPLLPVLQGSDQVRPSLAEFSVLAVTVAHPVGHAQLFDDPYVVAEMVVSKPTVALSLLELS